MTKLVRKPVPSVISRDSAHTIDLDLDDLDATPHKVAQANVALARSAPVLDISVDTGERNEVKRQEREKPAPLSIEVSPSSIQTNTAEVDAIFPSMPPKVLLPISETDRMTTGAVQPPGSTVSDAFLPSPLFHVDARHTTPCGTDPCAGYMSHVATDPESDFIDLEEGHRESEVDLVEQMGEDDEDVLILNGGVGIPIGPDGEPCPLLPPIAPQHTGRKCLVLDLDETLVHSSFGCIQHADYVVPVEIEYRWHDVNVIKRPGVDNFLKKMGEIYEVVVFTASLCKFADPVLDKLDGHQVVSHRLFRESCCIHKGNYVKDLSQLGRPIADTIILDNSPASYIFHPNNAVPVSSWFNDPHDTELTDLCPFLEDLGEVKDVRDILDGCLW